MKKFLFLIVALGSTAVACAQSYSSQVKVTIQNKTKLNLYFAPRYNLAFYDGGNDYSYFGIPNTVVGANALTKDVDYQEEGLFEPVLLPGATVVYSNGSTPYVGYGFQPNAQTASFDTTGPLMSGYVSQPNFFHKDMKMSWIRFAVSTNTLANASYGGGLAYPMPSGTTVIPGTTSYVNANNEIFRYYWPSTTTFTTNGITVNAVFISSPYVAGQPQNVTIIFY